MKNIFKSSLVQKTFFVLFISFAISTVLSFAATDDFTADGDVTVTGVTFGAGSVDVVIISSSTAESWVFDGGALTVTNPGSFKIKSSDSSVKTLQVTQGGTVVGCAANTTPGTSYVTFPTTAGVYVFTPSAYTDCTSYCTTVANAATYNAFPTCGAATCNTGYTISGSGSSATCVANVVGGAVPVFIFTPPPTVVAPTETPVTETPVTETPVTETPVTETPVTETPVTETPVTETPVTETPVTETPVTETPVTETPVTETPVINSGNEVSQAPSLSGAGSGVIVSIQQGAVFVKDKVENISEKIAAPIKLTVEIAKKEVQELREDKEVVAVTKEVITPVAQTTVAVASVVTATVIATSAVGANMVSTIGQASMQISQILRLSGLLTALGIRRKKPWGRVFNMYSGKSIADAQVQLYKKQFDKLVEVQMTDKDGRFSFIVSSSSMPGQSSESEEEYYLKVSKPGYDFEAGHGMGNMYHGQSLKLSDIKSGILNLEIPLIQKSDFEESKEGAAHLLFIKTINIAVAIFNSINNFLLIGGLILSVAVVLVVPTRLNISILVFYTFLAAIKVYVSIITTKSFGLVIDKLTKNPLSLAAVRVFDSKRDVLLTSRVTGEGGKFNFLLTPGKYYVTAVRSGYKPYKSDDVEFSKADIASFDVAMEKN